MGKSGPVERWGPNIWVEAAGHAQAEEAAPAAKAARSARRQVNRGALPAHLARVETLVDVESTTCPCCGPISWGR